MNTVTVSNNQFYSHYPKRIPKGTVEAERVLIRLDPEWDGLTVRIHWANQASGKEVVSLLERDKPNSIPWEVLSDLGELRMGLLGLDGETTVKPTIWLSYGYVVEGVDPESGDDPQPPTPSWEQQMVEQATAAAEAAKAAQEAAESAGPYAQAAQASAEAAKVSEGSAAASAQEAGQSKAAAAQAQASAQGHATTAQQAAQEAQAAQESAAQSAQTSATDAQRAETASQEAQDAAARAEAVDAYPRQEANDTFALALKVDTGKGTTHEIYPDPGSNVVVTAYGYTEQEGEGDPSPENVRPIKVGGYKLVEYKVTGDENYHSYTSSGHTFRARLDIPASFPLALGSIEAPYKDFCNAAVCVTGIGGNGFYIDPNSRYIIIGGGWCDQYSDIDAMKEDFKRMYDEGNPVTFWYTPSDESEATGLYTPSVARGDYVGGYVGPCIPLTEPLCDGDYVVSNQNGQCVEVHTAAYITVSRKTVTKETSTVIAMDWTKVPKCISGGGILYCSHFPGTVFGTNPANIVINFSKAGFDSSTALLDYCDEQEAAGTPVQVVYKRDLTSSDGSPNTVFPKDGIYTHAPVPLIARPDSTGKVIVSGEKEVSAVYNKSIKRALDELSASILQLGGAQNV